MLELAHLLIHFVLPVEARAHSLRVWLGSIDQPEEVQIAAILHDVVEDSDIGLPNIQELFGEKVSALVDCLTRRFDEQYFIYIARIKENPVATLIKLLDLKDNIRRCEGDKSRTSLLRRYLKAKRILEENL